eukprot:TRINITY_DN27166_c0_g2_i1.p1 TRINITY_DN27166_c0_g2~~TRINITY_DN27166_c0_g2_i1.p1  ORF type:complete len:340 (-),score=61.57 TRINITY_DN27166_c0_g2_i1:354-1343(-)
MAELEQKRMRYRQKSAPAASSSALPLTPEGFDLPDVPEWKQDPAEMKPAWHQIFASQASAECILEPWDHVEVFDTSRQMWLLSTVFNVCNDIVTVKYRYPDQPKGSPAIVKEFPMHHHHLRIPASDMRPRESPRVKLEPDSTLESSSSLAKSGVKGAHRKEATGQQQKQQPKPIRQKQQKQPRKQKQSSMSVPGVIFQPVQKRFLAHAAVNGKEIRKYFSVHAFSSSGKAQTSKEAKEMARQAAIKCRASLLKKRGAAKPKSEAAKQSSAKGIYWHKVFQAWQARATDKDGNVVYLGVFYPDGKTRSSVRKAEHKAIRAVKAYERKHGK